MDELVKLVEEWATDRELDQAKPEKQFLKVAEEFGEIGAALARNDALELEDAIGDTTVTLIILAMQTGLDFKNCLQTAYNVIAKRTGKTIDGVYVKSEDLEDNHEIK